MSVRSADGRGQSPRAADSVQRHLPRLRPDAEVAAVRQLPALHAAVPRRRASSSAPSSSRPTDFRPRLFRRSHRRRAVRACVPAGDVSVHARESHRRAARPVVRGQRAVVRRRSATAAAMAWLCGRGGRRRSSVHFALPPLLDMPKLAVSDYKGVSYARKFPDSRARLRARLAVRLSGGLLQLVPAFRARALRQRGLQPAEHARQRLSRHLHRRRRPERHHPRPAGERDRLLPLPADGLPLPDQAGARHVRRPVRRRHLDRGRAADATPRASPWRRATPRCSTPSAPTRACAISPATSSTIPRSASSTTRAAFISPTPRSASTSST